MYMRILVYLVFTFVWVLNSNCTAAGSGLELSSVIPWLQKHPDQVNAFASSLIHNDGSIEQMLPRELQEQVLTALSTDAPAQVLQSIAQLAVIKNDLSLADALQRKFLANKRVQLLDQNPNLVHAEFELLADETKRPRDAVMEINYPAGLCNVHYLAAEDGLTRADWLLSQSSGQFGNPDRGYVKGWRDRIAWILGEPRIWMPPNKHNDDTVSVHGRVLIDGEPAQMVRVAFLKPQANLVSGGGYRTFIHGLDVLASGVVPFPDSDFYDAMTDGSGKFYMRIKPGGPYSFVALPVQRAVTQIVGTSIEVRNTDCFRKNLGWYVQQIPKSQDLGTIEITLKRQGEKISRPVVGIMSLQRVPIAKRGDKLLFPFRVANYGGRLLKISGVKADCVCSTVHGESGIKDTIKFPMILKPSESVQWNTTVSTNSGMSLGDHSKSLLLLTDDPLELYRRIDFRFTLTDYVKFEPSILRFQLASSQKILCQTVRLVSNLSPRPQIKNISLDKSLPVKIEVAADGTSAVVTLDPTKLPPGKLSYYHEINLPVLIGGKEQSLSPIVIYCRMTDFPIEPTSFNFHRVQRGTIFKRLIKFSSASDFERFQSVESLTANMRVDSYDKVNEEIEIRFEILDDGPGTLRMKLREKQANPEIEPLFIDIPIEWCLLK